MDNNNNETGTSGDMSEQALKIESTATETVQEMTQDQLAQLAAVLKQAQPTNFKRRMQGYAGTAKAKPSKYWYNGNLILKEEFDKLSWEEIHASNNVIRKR